VRRAILIALAMLSTNLGIVSTPCAAQRTTQQQGPSIRVTVVTDHSSAVPEAEVHIVSLPDLIGIPSPNGTFTFKSVDPGLYQISVTYPGFRSETISDVVVVEGKTTELNVTLKEGLPKASDYRIHQTFENPNLYSKALIDIGQPLLCSQPVPTGKEWYRFIWVPTFDHPVFLRVDIESDDTAILLTQVWSGQGGYTWGKSMKNTRRLKSDEQSELFESLADIGFWTLPSQFERPPNEVVLDGTDWLIEGVRDGKCHVVTRYSSPLTGFFQTQFLTRVAKLKPYYEPDR
jgi:hypothetical protein